MSPRKRSSRRRTKRLPVRWRVAVALLVLFAVGGIGLLKWAQTPPGRLWLADRGVGDSGRWARQYLQERLLEGLDRAGVPADSVTVGEAPEGSPVTVRVRSPLPLLQLNVAVHEAFEGAGGTVLRGMRHEGEDGPLLELQMGTRRLLTHRLLATHGSPPKAEPPPLPTGRLALVIDDWGHNLGPVARAMLELDLPLTVAILPELRYSRRILTESHRAGKQAFLHLPMEPDETATVGPGEPAVLVGMDPADIRALTERCLDGLPGIAGVNSHMGSKATAYRAEMDAVMDVLAARGMVFLDSWTSSSSVAYASACDHGVPALKNDLFLDVDTEDPQVVEERLERLLERARSRGWAVGIGHVNEATLDALRRWAARLDPADVQPVFVADLLHDLAR